MEAVLNHRSRTVLEVLHGYEFFIDNLLNTLQQADILENSSDNLFEDGFYKSSLQNLSASYDDDEPVYSDEDLIWKNPDYQP